MWYDEVNLYNYNNPGFSSATGHFTQVVWKSTSDLGCGIAISRNGKIYGVSEYTKPGNYGNQYRANVLPKKSTEQIQEQPVQPSQPEQPIQKPVEQTPVEPSPSNSNFDECQQVYQATCLSEHNRYRAMHHAPPLKTNIELQKSALAFAQNLAATEVFKHSGKKGVGENLAYSYSSSVRQLSNCGGNFTLVFMYFYRTKLSFFR